MFIIYVFALHYIADFLLQSREMGKNKSIYFKVLMNHLLIQYFVIAIGTMPMLGYANACLLSAANALVHGVIDWNIWKLYKLSAYIRIRKIVIKKHGMWTHPCEEDINIKTEIANWKYWEDHLFYATIGLDQFLHAATLITLYLVV